jgi:2-oxoglutarate ferredoxin oxidoreductase subunit beta
VHDPSETMAKMTQALKNAYMPEDKIPVGLFYKNEFIPTFEERLKANIPNYMEKFPADHEIEKDGKPITSITKLIEAKRVL